MADNNKEEAEREVAAGLTIVGERLARHREIIALDDLRPPVLALLNNI